jgi:hypothetical protein
MTAVFAALKGQPEPVEADGQAAVQMLRLCMFMFNTAHAAQLTGRSDKKSNDYWW